MNGGYNPMRHQCIVDGCFNIKKRPKIEVFADCFPGDIAMSDVDATVERNGRFLFLEFKSYIDEIPTGQRIYYEKLTRLSPKIVVFVLCADAETMVITHIRRIYGGKIGEWEPTSLDDVKKEIVNWSDWCVGKLCPLTE